ncbi:hypothetical protein CPB86DRAFT_792216, partial [Serendipita vermifera]
MTREQREELCLICGLREGGGPWGLFWDGEECLDMIIKDIEEQKLNITLSREELREEIRNLLLLFNAEYSSDSTGYEQAVKEGSISPGPYFPFTSDYEKWEGWKAVAVGIFDEHSNDDAKQMKGRAVTSRLVDTYHGLAGKYYKIEGSNGWDLRDVRTESNDFLCLRAPYFYLQSWINRDSLPPRQTAFPLEPDMSFDGELYEIVDHWGRRDGFGVLDIIDYEGIDWILIDQLQDVFQNAFNGAFALSEALEDGLRGNDLIPALLNDFRVWQTCPPDRWISSTSSLCRPSDIQISQSGRSVGQWQTLPTEIVVEILSNVSLKGLLSFISSCRHLHHKFGDSSFLSMLLRTQLPLPLSDIHWFLPVSTVKGEVEKFVEACNESKSHASNAVLSRSLKALVTFDPDFPLWDFFRTNYPSDS